MRRTLPRLAIALGVAACGVLAGEAGAQAEASRFAAGDLVLVYARLRDCPNRLRLLDVVRAGDSPASLLDLGPVPILGRTAGEIQRELERLYRERLPGRPTPPMLVAPRLQGDAEAEVRWLLIAATELEQCGEEQRRRPERRPRLRVEQLAAR